MSDIFKIKNNKIVINKHVARRIKKYYAETNEINKIKAELLSIMENNNIGDMLSNGIYAKFTPEHTQNRFDTTSFKNDRPVVYKKYLKETNVSSSVSMKASE